MSELVGKKRWIVPDGYIPVVPQERGEGPTGYISHECACMVNITNGDARVKLTIFFEGKNPSVVEDVEIKARRSKHLRMDKLTRNGARIVTPGDPYSLLIESDTPIVVQMSRLDTTQPNMAFLSTMGYPLD